MITLPVQNNICISRRYAATRRVQAGRLEDQLCFTFIYSYVPVRRHSQSVSTMSAVFYLRVQAVYNNFHSEG